VKYRGNWIYNARRAEVRNRLVDDGGVAPDRAEQLLTDWEAEAERRREDRSNPYYWRDGARWVSDQLSRQSERRAP
jgi:hypothetical protein